MIIPMSFVLHASDTITPEQRAEAVAHASDADGLGIDEYLADFMAFAPFPAVCAHLMMFDPEWLFARDWVEGWVVTDAQDAR